jgi:hypothetical protein
MTKTLTTEAMQEIYEAAVHVEAVGDDQDACFELLCKLEDVGGTGATIRKLIDMVRAATREAQPVGEEEINAALRLHRLKVEGHSQLSDSFRAGFKYARRTAPPAPAVPDAIPEVDRGEGGSDIDYMQPQEIYDMGKTDGRNTCRAAMLAAAPEVSNDA